MSEDRFVEYVSSPGLSEYDSCSLFVYIKSLEQRLKSLEEELIGKTDHSCKVKNEDIKIRGEVGSGDSFVDRMWLISSPFLKRED